MQEKENGTPAMSFSSAQSTIMNQASVASPWRTPSPEKTSWNSMAERQVGTLMYPATPRTRPSNTENAPSQSTSLIELSPDQPKTMHLVDSPPKPLIQFSPPKKSASSCNTDLLIDLSMDDMSESLAPPASQFQTVRSKNKKKGTVGSSSKPLNLLD
jgi:hypothetical protein